MKSATIIKNKNYCWIYANSKTIDGLWIATAPFKRMELSTSYDQLTAELLIVLSFSKQNIPHPKDWKAINAEFLKNIRSKSLKSFYENAKSCAVFLEGNVIRFLPTKNLGGKGRFDHLSALEARVQINNREDVYNALDNAFQNCS